MYNLIVNPAIFRTFIFPGASFCLTAPLSFKIFFPMVEILGTIMRWKSVVELAGRTAQTRSITLISSEHKNTACSVGNGANRPFSGNMTIFSTPCSWVWSKSGTFFRIEQNLTKFCWIFVYKFRPNSCSSETSLNKVNGAVREGSQISVIEPFNWSKHLSNSFRATDLTSFKSTILKLK